MNISIKCNVSLSKKLRALLGTEGSLTLVVQDIVDGKGHGILNIDSETVSDQFDTSETAIMLTPVGLSDESPNSESVSHASIFSSVPQKGQEEAVVSKIGAVHAPEKHQVSKAIKKTAQVPKAFKEMANPQCRTWIENMEGLVEAIDRAKNKKSSVDLNTAQNDRERAVMMEIKEKEESIDIPAWIVNDKCGMLTINDLNISLPLNAPFDLSNISARRIIASKELKGLINSGYIKFISPSEKNEIIMKTTGEVEKAPGLDVFDSPEEAQMSIEGRVVESPRASKSTVMIDDNAEEMSVEELERPTEDENMIVNLTQDMPRVRSNIPPAPLEPRKTVHTSQPSEAPKSSNIKPIRKIER